MKTIFEQNGGTYRMEGDYLIPNLTMPEEPEHDIGGFGLMRRHYLKNHRKALFSRLLMSGKLNEHLAEIDQAANDRLWLIIKQMAKSEGVTEQLKAENQFLWIQRMNNIHHRAMEIVNSEFIYC